MSQGLAQRHGFNAFISMKKAPLEGGAFDVKNSFPQVIYPKI